MREMKDSGLKWIGEIPSSWKVMPNKYLMKKKKVICPVYNGEDILSLTMKGVIVRDLDAGGKMPTSFDGYQRLEPGNLLMCLFDIDVTPRCIGLIKQAGLSSPAYSQFELNGMGNAEYYCYYYTMLDNDKTLLHLAKNLRHSLTEDQLGAISVIVPPVQEQKRIANFLDAKCAEIDALTADIQTQIDTLEQFRKSVITEAVTKGINSYAENENSGIECIGKIPKGWKLTKFKYVAKVKSNLVNPEGYEKYPQISPDNIEKNTGKLLSFNTVDEAGIISGNHLFSKGQIIYSKIRPNLNKVTIAPFDGLCSADMYPIESSEKTKFILYMMLSDYFVEQVALVIQDRVKMPKINQDELGEIKVVIPPETEQIDIVRFLDNKCDDIDAVIKEKEAQLNTLVEYKKSLIYEYVTGKKEVPADGVQ